MREGTESGDVLDAALARFRADNLVALTHVVEWYRDLDRIGDQVLDLSESGQVVLGLDVFRVADVHSRNQTTKRSDAIALPDTEYGSIDMGRAGFQCTKSVGDCYERLMSASR